MIRAEFYNSPSGEVLIKPDGEQAKVLTANDRDIVNDIITAMAEIWPDALNAIKDLYKKSAANKPYYNWLIATRFVRCNFGEYDTLKLDSDGLNWHLEEVRCPLRGLCRHEGVICKPKRTTVLSDREMQVARLVGTMKAEEIADKLCISICTVRNHIASIKSKLGLRRTGAIASYIMSLEH